MNDENKIIIYQVFTRLFVNNNNQCVYNGDIATNGCGKMADFTLKALGEIKKLGATHIWYTGIIEHATQTDYRRYNISPDHPASQFGEVHIGASAHLMAAGEGKSAVQLIGAKMTLSGDAVRSGNGGIDVFNSNRNEEGTVSAQVEITGGRIETKDFPVSGNNK